MDCDKNFDCCFDEETRESDVETAIMNGGVSFANIKYLGCVEVR